MLMEHPAEQMNPSRSNPVFGFKQPKWSQTTAADVLPSQKDKAQRPSTASAALPEF
jgi:hypothetical protein